MTIHDILW